MTREEQRLEESRERKLHWKRWGPYLSERQWGTVREDYSELGKPGHTSLMTRRARAPIDGVKTGSPASATVIDTFALRWRCGMAATLF